MASMVSHPNPRVYVDEAEVTDACIMARDRIASDNEEYMLWQGISLCLHVIANFNVSSAESFIETCDQEIKRLDVV